MIKKFLGTVLALVCFQLSGFAFEDYIAISQKPVKKITSSNPEIIIANVLVTIMNEKNTIVITSKSKGKAVLTVEFVDEVIEIPVEVKEKKTIFKKNEVLEIMKIDIPPEFFQIDLPPAAGGVR